jgi:hypothetical protein
MLLIQPNILPVPKPDSVCSYLSCVTVFAASMIFRDTENEKSMMSRKRGEMRRLDGLASIAFIF